MIGRIREVFGFGIRQADVKKTIDTAAVKAEARVLVGEIRENLDALDGLMRSLPDPRE